MISLSVPVHRAYLQSQQLAERCRHQFTTPEHFLAVFLTMPPVIDIFNLGGGQQLDDLRQSIDLYIAQNFEIVPKRYYKDTYDSEQYQEMFHKAEDFARSDKRKEVSMADIFRSLLSLKHSHASHLLQAHLGNIGNFMQQAFNISYYFSLAESVIEQEENDDDFDSDDLDDYMMSPDELPDSALPPFLQAGQESSWRSMVTDLNEGAAQRLPLIGREAEIERTLQVLSRKQKNNPLHIGEAGVGKTALVHGLAARLAEGKVPKRLKGFRIYQVDLGAMIAGAQYRGEFEKRIKSVLDGVAKEGKGIIYFDEIHTLVNAGRGEGSMDAGQLLMPYLESGQLRCIGSTTYEEYNRTFSKSTGLVRRFQTIDIAEPNAAETQSIVEGLLPYYEEFHGVKFDTDVVEHAVRLADRYITDRHQPDKALDVIDESAAYRQLHPVRGMKVKAALVSEVVAKICKVDTLREVDGADTAALRDLDQRILAQIYGQDTAVRTVVEAVQMSRAGLLEEGRPVANLLFVGPTGVGKTELAKVLAKELGVELLRFDMSEYAEKHTVARLIGSPAGYVGYEDGGLLTDAIRKTPHCVLLLDEIEKAHADIYNLLLQVMDYASLTDSKGRKADFRHVVLIMTSNAGAQHAHQAAVGFGGGVGKGEAMMQQVRRTFRPEFINRLSATVVFNDMDTTMAGLILQKKIAQLARRLEARKVTLSLTPAATDHLLTIGYSKQYGAREMERIVNAQLHPLLMREVLFGRLAKGGAAKVDVVDGQLALV